uniref:Uncharacterized protein LOC111113734 n=1 Tax=Crassostrea virginica TaxID=6565 RepID=A0A8B8BWI4_CRAVI|nr:uncharacterized protein LOC111113734 [Crassostrea virginica]
MASREFVTCVVCQMLTLYFIVAYENLALNKPAWQKNPYPHRQNVGADLAVDGRKANPPKSDGQCTLSHGNDTAEWRVDLGGVYSIHHIFLQYMTGTSLWGKDNYFTVYFLGFSVYISNTTNKEEGTLCFKDTNYTKATIPNPINITCPYYGRYVIYYNNRTNPPFPEGYSEEAFSDFCEVEVYDCKRKLLEKGSVLHFMYLELGLR